MGYSRLWPATSVSGYLNIRIRFDMNDFIGDGLNIAVSSSSDPPLFFFPFP